MMNSNVSQVNKCVYFVSLPQPGMEHRLWTMYHGDHLPGSIYDEQESALRAPQC